MKLRRRISGAINFELFCRKVQHSLDDKHAMLASRAAIRRDDGLVGEDCCEFTVIVFDIVRSKQGTLAVEWARSSHRVRTHPCHARKTSCTPRMWPSLSNAISASWICPRSWVVATKFSARSSIHLTGRFNFIAAHGTSTSSW